MRHHSRNSISLFILLVFTSSVLFAQIRSIDAFQSTEGWTFVKSDGVNMGASAEKGRTGNAIRFEYDFTRGTGYGGIQKRFPMDLPENFEFTFFLRARSPANNFEIKFIDSTGSNVWWVNNHNYDFPEDWRKIRVKKRHIGFAWGPAADQRLKRIDRIEFTIASFVGGKGAVWIDDLNFEPLPPETQNFPEPSATASSFLENHPPGFMLDSSGETCWQSSGREEQEILVDFKVRREFGGLQINWMKGRRAPRFDVFLSDDGRNWDKAYSVRHNRSDVSFIRLPEAEAKHLKMDLMDPDSPEGFGIQELKFLDLQNSMTMNDFLMYAAKHSPSGDYPRSLSEQASCWTVTGVSGDVKEALINEDGMVEAEKGRFSIEPMIRTGDSLYHWGNVRSVQSMGSSGDESGFAFEPAVAWRCGGLKFTVRAASIGEANTNSALAVRYAFENLMERPMAFDFYLLIRPFQVNPWYQLLNLAGGAGKIHSIREEGGGFIAVDDKRVLPQRMPDSFGACGFDEGNVAGLLREGRIPAQKSAVDRNGLASGILRYSIRLNPREQDAFFVTVPFYDSGPAGPGPGAERIDEEMKKAADFWSQKTGHIRFHLPESADRIIGTYRSSLAYILVNRDRAGIQPGSRSYERSWIRDGALTSSALLKSGVTEEVREFIDWYAAHQYENGKVPCVVDSRGPDPVPENDSHGEMIFLIKEYFNFTRDTAFLRSKNKNVLKAVEYIGSLIAERSTDHYRFGNDSLRACYGLVPESISHEGYSAKQMHSYWDDFFTLKGLKDAAEIQKILGEGSSHERIGKIRDVFAENLYRSLGLAMKTKGIDYIPGCVELGDFDATSTTIALSPCNELNRLPRPQLMRTFDRYFEFFENRRDGKIEWINYTPYENRLIGSFVLLDRPDRAHALIEFFLKDRRPQGWNHWAEVVWKDPRLPRFIGDMPHTWVGSDFINAIRSMFVYENESDTSLVLGAALCRDWIDSPAGMSVEHLPTYYGDLSYSIRREKGRYLFSIYGEAELPAGGIRIRNFNGSRLPAKVTVNGEAIKAFNRSEIRIREFPSEVAIYY